MRKVHIVMQWGDRIDSVWSTRKKADQRAKELDSISWKIRVETREVNADLYKATKA